MEIAALQYPWPEWVNLDMEDGRVAVVAVADRVLSAHAGDGLDPESVCRLLTSMVAADTIVHAWLYSDHKYIAHVVERLGAKAIRGWLEVKYSCTRREVDSDMPADCRRTTAYHIVHDAQSEFLGLGSDAYMTYIALSCTADELSDVGLPVYFLRMFNTIERIGIQPDTNSLDIASYPGSDELISNYFLSIVPGGEHCTDCLFLTRRLGQSELVSKIVSAGTRLGWDIKDNGSVYGDLYEQIYASTM